MIGPDAEKEATIRYGMSAVSAAVQSTVPWATIAIHKSFGVASAAHFAPNNYKLAWPSYEMGALPVQGGVAVAYHKEIEAAADPEAKLSIIGNGERPSISLSSSSRRFASGSAAASISL